MPKKFGTIGFIGTGNMGSALAHAAAKSAATAGVRFLLANRTESKAARLAEELQSSGADARAVSNAEAARECGIIFLGVKPQMLEGLFSEIAPVLRGRADGYTLVTMAAGVSCARIRALAGTDCPVIRIMPNTPAAIGAGVVQVCSLGADEETLSEFEALLRPAGLLERIPENLIDAAAAVSGCGPAFVYMFIEALADGGVACGLPRDKAVAFAAGAVEGAARMVLESGKHPGALKDAVTSPAGTTIQGVRALEAGGFRSAAIEAVIAAYERTLEIAGK